MRNSFTTREYTLGTRDPTQPEPEDTENRSWGTFATDVAIDLARPIVSAVRTGTQAARMAEGDPNSATAAVDRAIGGAENWLRDQRSARARALDTASVMPGPDERSAWREPLASGFHVMLPSVPTAAAALFTGGGSLAARAGTAAAFGALGAGESINELRDFADRTPTKELMTLEPFQNAMREFNGDERAAREKLFNESLDWKANVANFAVNSAEFGVFLRGLGKGVTPGIKGRLVNALKGAGEGALTGAGEGAVESYTSELAKVRTGQQAAIDTGEIASGVGRGAVFGAPMAVWHGVGPQPIGRDVASVASQTINQQTGPAAPTTPPQAAPPGAIDTGMPPQPAAPGADWQPWGAGQVPPTPPAGPGGPAPGIPPVAPTGPTIGEPAQPAAPVDVAQVAPTPAPPAGGVARPTAPMEGRLDQAAPLSGDIDADPVQSFKTTHGSEYFLFPDNTTLRDKAAREGDPDSGIKERSAGTFFLTPGHEMTLRQRMAQPTRYAKRIAMTRRGGVGLQFTEGPSAGKFAEGTVGKVSLEPVVGMHPLELWDDGRRFHFGSAVTEVSERMQEAQAAAAPDMPPPPAIEAPQMEGALAPAQVPAADQPAQPAAPAGIDDQTRADLQAIMMGVPPALRQLATLHLQNRLQRAGRLTGADLPPALTARMTPEDVAVLRRAVEAAPDEAMGMVQSTPIEQTEAAYEAYARRYPDRVQVTGPEPQRERRNRPRAADIEPSRIDMRISIPEYEATMARQAAERREERETVIKPAAEARRQEARGEEARRRTEIRRHRVLAGRRAERGAKGRAVVERTLRGMIERFHESDAKTPEQWTRLRDRARAADEARAAAGQPRELVELLGERPTTEEERARARREQPREVPRPTGDVTLEEDALRSAITDFNKRLADVEPGDRSTRMRLTNQRVRLVRLAKRLDDQRAEQGLSRVFEREIKDFTKAESDYERVNRALDSIADLQSKTANEIAGDRRAQEVFDTIATTNAKLRDQRRKLIPFPSWLYDAIMEAKPEQMMRIAREARAAMRARQAEYEAARQRLLAEKRAAPPKRTVPVSIDAYSVEARRDRGRFERRTAIEKERMRDIAARQQAPSTRDELREQARAEVERRHEEARERVARGEPLVPAGTKLPSLQEVYDRLEQGLKRIQQKERTTDTRIFQYKLRDARVALSLKEALERRFGKDKAKLNEFLYGTQHRREGTDRPRRVPVNEMGLMELSWLRMPKRPSDEEMDQPASLQAHVKNQRIGRTNRQVYEEEMERYWRGKQRQHDLARRLHKFLDFAIPKVEADLAKLRKDTGLKGSIKWTLPEGKLNPNTNRYEFSAGTTEPISDRSETDPLYDAYNFANDLQKLREALRYQFMGLDETLKKTKVGDRLSTPDDWARTGSIPTHAMEMRRYMSPLNEWLRNFALDMDAFLNQDWRKLKEQRRAKSSETTEGYLRAPDKGPVETEEGDLLDQMEYTTPGSAHFAGKRIEQQYVDQIDRNIERERRELEQQGRNNTTEQQRRVAQMHAEFPLRSFSHLLKRRLGGYDEDGLPANRFRREEFDTSPVGEYERTILDGHEQLNRDGDPRHSMISEPGTTRAAIDNVKAMIANGQVTNLPTEYINDSFLDALANVTGDTKVYHAPYDVVSGGDTDAAAYYDTPRDRLVVSMDVSPELYARAVIHETAHAATERRLLADARFASQVRDLLVRASTYAKRHGVELDQLPRDLYGLTNPSEFLTETISNQKFRDYLAKVSTPTNPVIQGVRNALNAFYRMIRDALRRVMGAKDGDTALDVLFFDQSSVLGQVDQLVARTIKQMERRGRPAYVAPSKDKPKLYDDGRYYLRIAGAKAFADDVATNLRGWSGDMRDKTKYLYETRSKNRGMGLSWHTMFDMTQRGSQQFRAITSKLYEAMEKVFATRANIVREQDMPKLAKVEKFFASLPLATRTEVSKHLLDESYHGAFVDVPLDDPRNKHVKADSLAWAQVRQEHQKLMDKHAEYSKIPGYTETRDLLHKWGDEREAEIRSARVRDLLRHSGLIPDNLSIADQDRLITAMENLIESKKQLSAADKQVILQHLGGIDDPRVKEVVTDINSIDDIKRLAGPYIPFTRRGRYAVSGYFKLPIPKGATMLDPPVNRQTGKPIGDPSVVFDTEAQARAYVEQVTKQFGITQLDGGRVAIDRNTGQRARNSDGKVLRGTELENAIKSGAPIDVKYYVKFQAKLLEFHPTEYDAKKASDAWRAAHGANIQVTPPMDVYHHDARQNEQYVSAQLQKFGRRIESSDIYSRLHDDQKRALSDMMALAGQTYTMRRGVKQRYLPRGYVMGASQDVVSTFKEYAAMTAGYIAKLRHGSDISEYSKQQRDYIEQHQYEAGENNTLLHQRIYNAYQTRLHSPTQNVRDTFLNRTVDRALRYTMLDKLPSIAYFTINATEPGVIAAPLMAGRHSYAKVVATMSGIYKLASASRFMTDSQGNKIKLPSFAAAGWADLKASLKSDNIQPRTDYTQLLSQRVEGEPDAEGLRDLFRQAGERGIFDSAASLEYDRAFVSAPAMVDRVADYLQNIFMAANTAVENLNRFVTVGTAYRVEASRLAKDESLTPAQRHQQAVEYAIEISHMANGQYANFNAPERFNTGPLARILFQFKKYSQRIVANYMRAAANTFSSDPVLRKHGMRQLGYMFATQMLVAGAMGLPVEPFSIPINTLHIAGLLPYNADDVWAGWRQWVAKNWSPELGEVIFHGPLRLTGIDVSSRLGQSSLLTYGSPSSTKPRDLQASLFTLLGGAAGSTGMEMLQGVQAVGQGVTALMDGADTVAFKKFGEAGQHLVPLRVANDVLQAINRSDLEGMRTQSGRAMREPYSLPEALIRGTGFMPAPEAESQEARRAIKQASDRVKADRKRLIDAWVRSPPADREGVQATIRSFNLGKPDDLHITRSDLLKAQGTYRKARAQPTETMGLALDRQVKTLLPDAGAYMTR